MTKKQIALKIDDRSVTVADGTMIVDAAKKIGNDIPVFCYHPKMAPVGMCRMCLVEVGRPVVDRNTGEIQRQADGSPRLSFGPKLETACTTPVSEGMVVVTDSENVKAARREMLELFLTSHPLDCPVCDKGGECPLQNLTMGHAVGTSRFRFNDKMRLQKQVPLGELIYLDRERCIQCGRCVRFQHEVADDPVIDFYARGRTTQIMTQSQPGFDSIFSGNTTDICPVGALTTADFRFGARPWEMKPVASLCAHCPVGCNLVFNVRREAKSDGRTVIKRVMPRQNEQVNEIWLCDKGRLAYHYTESDQRLTEPLVRREGELKPATWDEALDLVAEKLRAAGNGLVTLAGGRLANEDLFNLRQLTKAQNGKPVLYSWMAGGDMVALAGLGVGSNFGEMGKGTVIMVAACDLHEEAPVWWLRVKQAAERGATLLVAGPRPTRLDAYAAHVIRYSPGEEVATLAAFLPERVRSTQVSPLTAAIQAIDEAENVVILFGSDGLGLDASAELARICADLLIKTHHIGRPNNGLLGVWPTANTQGAWDMGFQPSANLAGVLENAKVVLTAAVDPAGDDPRLVQALRQSGFMVAVDLFLTETGRMADVVLPAQAYTEREGTFTSGERRVQRYYPAVPARPGPRADFAIAAQLGERLGLELEGRAPSLVMLQIARDIPDYAAVSYEKLAEVAPQWPIVGRADLYYGGTTYANHQGLGVQLAAEAERSELVKLPVVKPATKVVVPAGSFLVLPVRKLYDRGQTVLPTALLHERLVRPTLWLNPALAAVHGLVEGTPARIEINEIVYEVAVHTDAALPQGVALAPRNVGLPIFGPVAVKAAQS